MTAICRISLLLAAASVALPALATPITGGFDVTGYANTVTITSQAGLVVFGLGQETVSSPSNGTGTFASITPGTPLDFTQVLSLYLVYNGFQPTVFTFTFNGDDYAFQATSYLSGGVVKIAGIMTDTTTSQMGYGEVSFYSPSGGVGPTAGSFTTTSTLHVYPDTYAPEPSSFVLLATGTAGAAAWLRRRRRA